MCLENPIRLERRVHRQVTADREPTLPADASKGNSRDTLERHGLLAWRIGWIGDCSRIGPQV